ncbi:MAG: DUF2959 domain-containing protein [Proteobacteria bacterium]|nr:DUF2959 domain-containing protein [Pseudomonadota bacterium]
MYYDAWESAGVYKRDILVDRVENAMEAQTEAKEEFKDALEAFSSVVTVEPSKLKSTYETLSSAFEDAKEKAEEVTDRIDSVESVSKALFEEWSDEIDQISNPELRRSSARQLKVSRGRYNDLITSMRKAEARMGPVLTSFSDHVLYLKHNLNAQAIASLKNELGSIETNVARLIKEMEASIAQSEAFIKEMGLQET